MKKIGKVLLIFLMIFTVMSFQKNVYAYDEQLSLDLLPVIEDNESSSITTYVTEYGEDEARTIIGQRLKNAFLNGDSEVSIADLNLSTDKLRFVSFLRYYFPFISNGAELNGVSSRNNILTKIYISNTMTLDETKKYFNILDQEVSTIISFVSADMDDIEKALVVHDYLVNYCKYQLHDLDDDSFRSGGILFHKTGVCQAYTYAYQYIMNQLGMECYVVVSSNMNHAWNIISINQHYYHVDVTWDDPIYDNFGRVKHLYFLLSDEEIKNNRHYDWDRTDLKCDDNKYDDYYWKDATSPIINDGENTFFARESGIYKRNKKTQDETLIKVCDKWKVFDSSNGYWVGNYSGLFMKNHCLYYNTSSQIRCMDENGENDKEVYTPATSTGLVYGIRYNNNYIEYVIQEDPEVEDPEVLKCMLPINITQIILPKYLELAVGTVKKLDYTILPTDYNENVIWSSDHPEIVQVDQEGNIQCNALGDAIIAVTSHNGLSSKCQIHVIERQQLLGDVNGDGGINFLDAIMVLRHDAEIIELEENQLKAADVNKDGEVNFLDSIMILRYDAEIIDSF
ncbi:dockerin type I domain-containing protein [Faecalibacillus intestinalis]|uniref:dockerin type I domain-containing protein n=1 Tax=Faecalibacillus intestinalis TaxID=1982626 RepID=UPI003520C2F2